ncbi:hypothetical protein Glove_216g156 [Diversispora epigaea]|uniref:Uncharacterized protein n=1 Tax=Diversispora epigaea TaxID=1348612 RepID=A0A397IR92_9GLOM|nr:hypothetical protein Glove_216g156 [Diversispora epigaea]
MDNDDIIIIDDDIISVDNNEDNDNNLSDILSSKDEDSPNKRQKKRINCPGNCVCAKNCNGKYINNNLCIECKRLKSNVKLANHDYVILCVNPCALDLFRQNLGDCSIQNIRRLRTSLNVFKNPDLCFENVVRFKRFLDSINYTGPITAMSDNTKLKSQLRYSSQLGCIIVLLPKFPPVIVILIPNNGKDSAETIANLHKKLILEIAPQLNISILSIGLDGAASEFRAQSIIMNTQITNRIEITDRLLNIKFSCPIFPNIGPVIRIQDPKHAKKNSTQFNSPISVLYKHDVIKLDRQDDEAAYRSFCHQNLVQCLNVNKIKEEYEGELVDSYLNKEISPIERIRIFTYTEFPLIPWMHGSKACEYVFGIAQQIRADFDFAEILQMVPKISQYIKSSNDNFSFEKEKSVHEGMLMSDSLPIENLQPIVLIETTTNPSFLSKNINTDNDDDDKNNDLMKVNQSLELKTETKENNNLSHAIGQASEQIANIELICNENNESVDDDIKFQVEID